MRGLIAVVVLAFCTVACGDHVSGSAAVGAGGLPESQDVAPTTSATTTVRPSGTPVPEPTTTEGSATADETASESAEDAGASAEADGGGDAEAGSSSAEDQSGDGDSDAEVADPSIPSVSRFEPSSSIEQAVVVKGTSWSSTVVTVETWERDDSSSPWTLLGTGGGRVGYSGMKITRVEGDGSTPAGMFRIPWGFGTGANPNSNGMTWRTFDDDDYWVGDSEHAPTYNTYQTSRTSGWDTSDAEWLWGFRTLYEYAWVIDFNRPRYGTRPASEPQPILSGPGSGSAIFLHVQGSGATAGCVSVPRSRIQSISRWLDPGRNPVIIIGEDGWLDG